MRRVHPAFPTLKEVNDNPQAAYSDHAMITSTIDLGQGNGTMNLLSLNMLGAGMPSAFI